MTKKMTAVKTKTDAELFEMINTARATLQTERFKDRFSRKASIIRTAKLEIARVQTELSTRRKSVTA